MRLINLPTKNAGEFLLVIALLLVVALSVPIWLSYGEGVQAGHYSGNSADIAEQPQPTPTPTPVVSRGVAWHGAEAWQAAGYKGRVAGTDGRRIKVGIIDVGFKGFSDLQLKGELPSNSPTTTRVWTKCYPANTLANCESSGDKPDTAEDESKHGAAVAEIIMDVAPEVDLYISNPPSEGRLQETVVWMAQQGVDVINQSLRWSYSAPGDGTYVAGPAAPHSLKAIDLAVNGGTVNGVPVPGGAIWVNSGGNEALKTWTGPFTDEYGSNNIHEFAKRDEKNTVHLVPGKKLDVVLRWKDRWGYAGNTVQNTGANCDLKLNLYRVVGNLVTQVPDSDIAIKGVSDAAQSGKPANTPYEIISYTIPKPATAPAIPATPAPYRIYIDRKATSPCATTAKDDDSKPAWLQMRSSVRLEHTSAEHHMSAPAESNNAGMLAVGAAVSGSRTVDATSSRGPDLHNYPNGRTKPNLVGATCVRTVTDSRFCGTSAAAPHVAGLAALILGREPTTYENNPGALVTRLEGDAVQRGAPNPNNNWGEGFVYLSHPTGTASFSVAHSVIPKGQSRRFTVNTNVAFPPGVQVKVSPGSLSLSKDCSSSTGTTRRSGATVAIWGCSETRAGKIWIYDGNTLLLTHTVIVPPDASLSNLTISSVTLSPTFASGKTSYTAQVPNNTSSVTVTPTTTTPGATISVGTSTVSSGSSQAVNLNVGDNSISIAVAATGYTTRTYTVTVTRAMPTPVASLSNLTISSVALSPTFASRKTSYTAQVPNNTSSLTVTPTTTTPGATIQINRRTVGSGSGRSVNLIVGSTIIRIVVAATGYTTRTYTITVTRAAATPVASLSNLTISSGTLSPTFASGKTSYTAQVPNNTSSLTVTPTTTTPGATISVGTSTVSSGSGRSVNLIVGSTIIRIVVAATGYTTRTYTITVTRAAATPVASLSNLTISSGTLSPTFASGTTAYTAQVANNINSITVTPATTTPGATIRVGTSTVSSGSGRSVNLKVGDNAIRIAVSATGYTTRTYTITVTRAPASPRPPTGLSLSTVSGEANELQLTYTRSQSPHRYQFQLERQNLSDRIEPWTVVDTNSDSRSPETFTGVARGYHYRAKGRNCADSLRTNCGDWSGYTNVVELSNPTIAISGLTGSYLAGDTDAFSVTLSDLTLDQPYTVTLITLPSIIGSNYLCYPFPPRSFTPTWLSRTVALSLTLHTCQLSGGTATTQSGTVTAQLRKGNARGAIVATATAAVTVTKATGSLSPTPMAAFTVGHDQTFTLNTNVPNSTGVYISATYPDDTGRLTLPTTQGCHQARSGRIAVNGNAITVRGCVVGKATLKVYRRNSAVHLSTYEVTINASTTALSPLPTAAAFTVGHDRTFTVTTDIADEPGLYISATYSGDTGRLTFPSNTQGCHQNSSGRRAANGNTITIRGCIAGQATIKVYRRNSSVHFATYEVTINASTTALSPLPLPSAAAFTVGHDRTFTVTTDIADDPGLYISATYSGDTGRLTFPTNTQGCHQASSGLLAANGNTITIRGCIAGQATIKVYRRNSSVHFATYEVTVNASNTSLSPAPATFTIGTNQTFTLTTDIANNPGIWVGLNYAGDTGRLVMSNQSCQRSSVGTAAVNGNSFTLKPCRAGTVTIKVNRSNSSVTLVSYEVTINSS